MSVVYIVLNALLVSISNVLGGRAATRLRMPVVVTIAGSTTLAFAVPVALLSGGTPSTTGLALGFVAGVFGGSGIPVAYRAFARGPVGVVGAVLAVVGTAWLTLAGVVTGEPISLARCVGVALCLVAIVMVTYRPRDAGQRVSLSSPALAVAAGTLFACFVVTMSAAPQADGQWPLVGARFGVTTVATLLLVRMLTTRDATQERRALAPRGVMLAIGAGAADLIGNILLLRVLTTSDFVLLAVFAPLAPIFTAIIGRAFLAERLTRWQFVGLAVASGAVILASI